MKLKNKNLLVLILLVFYLNATLFDVVMSKQVYDKNPELFLKREYNRRLTAELKEGFYFLFTTQVILILILFPLMIFSFSYNSKSNFVFYFCSYITFQQSFFHIVGGLSWLI